MYFHETWSSKLQCVAKDVSFTSCTCFPGGSGRWEEAVLREAGGGGQGWGPHRQGDGFHHHLAPRVRVGCQQERGLVPGKSYLSWTEKGKEGLGLLSGPFQILPVGVWAEPRAALGLSQNEPALAPSGMGV